MLYLIDGSSFLYRFHYAMGSLSYNGHPTGAIFGFARMLLDLDRKNPEYIAVMFDTKQKTFRVDLFEHYKENRPPMPDELSVQVEPIKELIGYFGIEIVELDGYEADDLIATFAARLKNEFKIIIVANDKDLFQMVENNRVLLYDPVKKITYDESAVYEKLGVKPSQVADYLALVGDSIDNVPGVKSIGPKTARELLARYDSCEGILQHLSELKPRLKKAIEDDGNLLLYKQLTTIRCDVPIEIDVERLRRKRKDVDRIREFFIRFGFKSLLKEFADEHPQDAQVAKTDRPILFYDGELKLIENGELKRAQPGQFGGDFAVYGLKELLWLGCEFDRLPYDIKLACYLIHSDSQGNPDGCFELADPKMHLSVNSVSSLAGKLSLALSKSQQLIENYNMSSLLWDVETPLSVVLYKMEKRGVKINVDYLIKFKNELENKQKEYESRIYALAGERFNINSTKELQRILFEKLGIKPLKKTKTGYSTDSETLLALSKDHEIATLILAYREIVKVVSTYVVPFIEKVDENNRLHTTFNQTATSTGRLSSSNPNLQNLPAGDDEIHAGIRRSVVAEKGYKLVCSDYSQIELRVLAHMSEDPELVGIFERDEDVHTQTAVRLFGVHPSMVDHNLRRIAKTVNFGIIYGMGYVSLARTLGIERKKAQEIIQRYFERFKRVREFIDSTIEKAKKDGYVETFFRRRRYFANINSPDKRVASFEERAAVNAVIQGTAADIIKIAMVRLGDLLKDLDAHMVLQVHDELLIEAHESIVDEAIQLTRKTMENVAKFRVPLKVHIQAADNWLDAK